MGLIRGCAGTCVSRESEGEDGLVASVLPLQRRRAAAACRVAWVDAAADAVADAGAVP